MNPRLSLWIFVFFAGVWQVLWIFSVNPFPGSDTLLKTYFPLLNYLKGAQVVGNQYNFLVELYFPAQYPHGLAILAFLIHLLGLGKLFLYFPYLFCGFHFMVFCLVLYKLPKKHFSALEFSVLFFFPGTLVMLRDYSVHSLIALLSILGLVCFVRYMEMEKNQDLSIFVISSFLAISFKHLGVWVYLVFLISLASYRCFGFRLPSKIFFLVLLPLIGGLFFYPWNEMSSYFASTVSHTHESQFSYIFPLALLAIFPAILYKLSHNRSVVHRFSWKGTISPFLVILFLFSIYYFNNYIQGESRAMILALATLYLGLGAGVFLSGCFIGKPGDYLKAVLVLIPCVFHLSLFLSWLARTTHLLYFPAFLLLVHLFCRPGLKFLKWVLLILFFIFSNAFPGLEKLKVMELSYLKPHMYFQLFNGYQVNYLGWQECQVPSDRKKIIKLLESHDLAGEKENTLYLAMGMHFSDEMMYVFPDNLLSSHDTLVRLDDLSIEHALQLRDHYLNSPETQLEEWISDGFIPVLLFGKDSWMEMEDAEFSLEEEAGREDFNPNHFLWSLKHRFYQKLKKSEIRDKYYKSYLVNRGVKPLALYLHRKLKSQVHEKALKEKERKLKDEYSAYMGGLHNE